MKDYANWIEIQKVHPQDEYQLKCTYAKMIGICKDLSYLCLNDFLSCCNSIFIAVDKIYGATLGIIAIRRVSHSDIESLKLEEFCVADRSFYRIEALYCDSHVSIKDCITMINTAIVDKNDGFIFYKPNDTNILDNEEIRRLTYFDEISVHIDDGSVSYYIKNPSPIANREDRVIKEGVELA